jgi:hypothetical protein
MNPYTDFTDLLFTCVDGPKAEVVATMLAGFNEPDRWSPRDHKGEAIVQHFTKETKHDFSLAYIDQAERDTTQAQRVLFGSRVFIPAGRFSWDFFTMACTF